MAKKLGQLGAATDDPLKLIDRAISEYSKAAPKGKRTDTVGVRQAAEKGWLAISSLADVAASKLGMPAPGGASARRETLRELERVAKLRKGSMLNAYESARTVLHGECFHGDTCPIYTGDTIEGLKPVIEDGLSAINKLKPKKR